MLLRNVADRAFGTLNALPVASASAPSVPVIGGSTASDAGPLDPTGVLTEALNARPATDWAAPTTANPAVSPTTSPRAASPLTQCLLMPFIGHSFREFLDGLMS
jgi:hypothetical protein